MKKANALPLVAKATPGLAVHKGKDDEMNLNDQGIGDHQAEAFGEALKAAK